MVRANYNHLFNNILINRKDKVSTRNNIRTRDQVVQSSFDSAVMSTNSVANQDYSDLKNKQNNLSNFTLESLRHQQQLA